MNHFLRRFLALLVTLWTTGAMLAYDFESGGIYYDLVDGNAKVAQSDWENRYSGTITIPSTVTYDGAEYAVTGIGESAFSATDVTEVNIPESVTFIGSGAFTSCHSLTSLIMPAGLEVLQGNAFDNCVNLQKLVMQGQNPPAECGWQNLDNTVIYVPEGCLSNYINMYPWDNYRINLVEGDGSVDYVLGFQDNGINFKVNPLGSDNLMVARYSDEESKYKGEVVIPSNVEYEGKSYKVNSVQSDALSWCQELTKLTLPASIDSIGYNIVGECENFRKLVMLRPTPPITEWQDYLRKNSIVVYVPEGSLAAYSEASPWNQFNLVEGDGSIDYVAGFAIDSINYKVTPLGSDNVAVSRYTNDESKYKGEIVIPNVVEYEGKSYSVNSIDREAFDWCEELTKLTLPVTLTTIGEGAFNGCQNLKKLILENPVPAEIQWIGLNQDCIIYVPEGSLEAYKSNEQWRWYNLVEGDGSVDYVVSFEYEGINYKANPLGSDNVMVAQYTDDESKYKGEIVIPDAVEYAGKSYRVNAVQNDAFAWCQDLTKLILPASIDSISSNIVYECQNLRKLVMLRATPPVTEWQNGINDNLVVYVPEGSLDAYKNAEPWNRFNLIEGDGSVDYVVSFAYDGINYKANPVGSDNVMVARYTDDDNKYKGEIVIPEVAEYDGKSYGVNAIADNAFAWCEELTKLTLPASIDSISYNIVGECQNFRKLVMLRPTPPVTQWQEVLGNSNVVVYVPEGSLAAYSEAWPWNNFNLVEGDGSIDYVTSFASGNLYYKVVKLGENRVEVSRAPEGEVYSGDIVIPSVAEYNGTEYSVVRIGENAFANSEITSVVIPETIEEIRGWAFRNCASLASVSLPNKSLNYRTGTFAGCSALTEMVLPDNMEYITDRMFQDCSSLRSITFGRSINNINYYAFAGCNSLENIVLTMSTPPYCGDNAFSDVIFATCQIQVPGNALDAYKNASTWSNFVNYTEGESLQFYVDKLHYSVLADGTTVELIPIHDSMDYPTAVEIPSVVKANDKEYIVVGIGDYAFNEWRELTSVTIPETVTYIGRRAFGNTGSLREINLPSSLRSIGENAFIYSGISEYNLPDGLETIERQAFFNSSIRGISIPASVIEIGRSAFGACWNFATIEVAADNLSYTSAENVLYSKDMTTLMVAGSDKETIEIPSTVTSIAEDALHACGRLQTLNIPASVLYIGDGNITNMGGLQTINVDSDNQNYSSIDGVLYNKEQTELICMPRSSANTDFVVPATVKVIGSQAFGYNLSSIQLNEGLESIGNDAFRNASIQTLTIPSTVVNIAWNIFNGSMKKVIVLAQNPPYMESQDNHNAIVYVPEESLEAYRNANGWSEFNILPGDGSIEFQDKFAENGIFYHVISINNAEVEVVRPDNWDDYYAGKVVVPATATDSVGNVYRVTKLGEYAFSSCPNLKEVVIDSIEVIGNWVFAWSENLERVNIPDGVEVLNAATQLFENCRSLKEVRLPAEFGWLLGSYAFRGCESLESFEIPKNVSNIRENAFEGCRSLTSITLPEGLGTILESAFQNCESLISMYIPANVSTIGRFAFRGCKSMKSFKVAEDNRWFMSKDNYLYDHSGDLLLAAPAGNTTQVIPDQTTEIPEGAFQGSETTGVDMPESLETIGNSAFADCPNLEVVTVPNQVTAIGDEAFKNCESLTTVTIGESVETIGNGAFDGCENLTEITMLSQTPPSFGASQIQSKVAQLASASLRIKLPEVKLMPVPAAFATRAEEDEAPVDGAGFSQAVYENCKLYVPAGAKAAYEADGVWGNFNNIEEVANPVESISMTEAIEMGVCTTQPLEVTFNPADADNRKVTWMSADTDIVTIVNSDDASCTLKAVTPGEVKIIATSSNGKKAYCMVTVNASEIVKKFTINPESHTGHIGEAFDIETVIDDIKKEPVDIEWKSDNEEVASVDQTGHVVLNNLGKATITAYCQGFTATCNVEVVRKTITSISISPDMFSGKVGDSTTLTVNIEPEDYDIEGQVTWWSDNNNVATVEPNTGYLQIVGIGEANIHVYVDGATAYCHVVGVEPVVVTGISLDRDEYTGYLDTGFKLTATIEPAGTEAQVEWTSSDASVATVDENGNVALVGVGTAIITASCEGFDASCEVTVVRRNPTPIKVISVKLSETEVELELGAEYKLTATVAPSYATNKNLIWSSSDVAVVSVDNGKLTALAAGEAVITVKTTDGSNLEATCRVSVIDPSGVDSAEGESLQVIAANGVIIVKGAKEGSAAEVYSMAGKCVLAKTIESTVEELPVPAPGVYLVRVAGKTFKVAL